MTPLTEHVLLQLGRQHLVVSIRFARYLFPSPCGYPKSAQGSPCQCIAGAFPSCSKVANLFSASAARSRPLPMVMEEAKPPVAQCGSPNTVLDPAAFFQEQRVAAKVQASQLYQLDHTICSPISLPAGGQVAGRLYPGGQVKLSAPMLAQVQARGMHSLACHGVVVGAHRPGHVQTRSYQTREQSQQSSSGPDEEAGPGGSTIGPDGLKRGPWTKEEDAMLAEYVQRFGPKDWSEISTLRLICKWCGVSWYQAFPVGTFAGAPAATCMLLMQSCRRGSSSSTEY